MSENDAAVVRDSHRLRHFPISFFASVMGLLGLTLALERAEADLGLLIGASWPVMLFSVAVLAVISLLYLLKLLRYPGAVAAEWMHPVRIAFFPAISISLLLLATALRAPLPEAARLIWLAGAALQLVLTLSVVANWIGHRAFLHAQLSPAWFIPAVGNIVAPIAGSWLGYAELSWFFFSAGMVFWVVLLTLVMNRLVFHDPLPAVLQPTLVILIAPPAVGFIAYAALTGAVDPFARIMMNAAYLFALIVLTQLPRLFRIRFALSFWALSFPVAALAIASFRYGAMTGSFAHMSIGTACLGLLIVVIAVLVWRTSIAIVRGEICLPE